MSNLLTADTKVPVTIITGFLGSLKTMTGLYRCPFKAIAPYLAKIFQQFLDYQLLDTVFRAKGVLYFAERPKRHLFQLSGRRFTIDASEWTATPKNQLY